MTLNDLAIYSKIKEEISQLKNRIKEIEEFNKSNSIILFKSQSNYTSESALEKRVVTLINLKEKLKEKLDRLLEEEIKIENFLDSIYDEEIRIIVRKKFIENKSWKIVGEEIHNDRTTPYYKLKKYLERRGKIEENKNISQN